MRKKQRPRLLSFVFLGAAIPSFAIGCSSEVPTPPSTDVVAPAIVRPMTKRATLGMSPMARLAHRSQLASRGAIGGPPAGPLFTLGALTPIPAKNAENCGTLCEDEDGYQEGPAGGQAETSIAVDGSGQHVVVGYNDTRGFFAPGAISVSGFAYSDDGGKTFTDGGQLPTPGNFVLAGTAYPQVFGDPDVKYLGGCTFVYSSILVTRFNDTATVQTLGLHRSSDCGHTWEGPFEIPAASNPTGQTGTSGNTVFPLDAADKEYIDVDPDTGRLIVGWSNFTTGGEQLSVAYTDNARGPGAPTWSPQIVVGGALDEFDQSANPRFAGNGSSNAYAAWSIRAVPGDPSGLLVGIGFARSTDNGATWEPPRSITTPFFGMDQVLGNDRVHDFPALAVDNSRGRHRGTVYVAYADNDAHDGSDVVIQRSTDGGLTFSAPVALNSRPGADRAQWFPWIAVDKDTGRVSVIYYDQGVATSGDLTEVSLTFSDDGGATWSPPRPISKRPFKAGWGNDTGQPNLGDYIQAVAQGGELFAEFASTAPTGFADGQPNLVFPSFPTPDATFARIPRRGRDIPTGGVQLADVSFTELNAGPSRPNGNLDPGDVARFRFAITNSVTNPINARTLHDLRGFLSSSTPGVAVLGVGEYEDLRPGATRSNEDGYLVRLARDFVPGTPIEFTLDVRGEDAQLAGKLFFTQQTGTPDATIIFAESFDAAPAGGLPAGWANVHVGGANVVPWVTTSTFCGATSPGAFHANANDSQTNPTRFERLLGPPIVIPSDAQYVTLDFDVCYDTEDDPNFDIQAYDGLVLRFTDETAGRFPNRAVLAEAFETDFTTGSLLHYPKHFPRNSSTAYFQDMSAWAGDSQGMKHVHLRLPGMSGSTVQPRFEFTQDSGGTCADIRPGHTCGVFVDNIVMRAVKSVVPPPRFGATAAAP